MKILLTLFILGSCTFFLLGQNEYKGIPVIKANSKQADIRIGKSFNPASWNISPKIEYDSLFINCYNSNEDFVFYTDLDSIQFNVKPNQIYKFYVLLKGKDYALTVVKGIEPNYISLKLDTVSINNAIEYYYEENSNTDYLNLLRSKYPMDSLISLAKSDKEKTLIILNWVHNRWEHSGWKMPRKSDAIYILDKASKGKQYRCVEYGIVLTACLNSIGLKTRTLGLMTKDVETRKSGAGHVLSEVYLNDMEKWVIVDGQWDAMPELNGIPLNAVEFQKAISESLNGLEIESLSNTSSRAYIEWIYPYLFYINTAFDNRIENKDRWKLNGKSRLMLVPLGENYPSKFQGKFSIDYCIYTNSYLDFYQSPNLKN